MQPLALAESGGSKRKEAPAEGPRFWAGRRLDALRARGAEPLSPDRGKRYRKAAFTTKQLNVTRQGRKPNGRDSKAGPVHDGPVRQARRAQAEASNSILEIPEILGKYYHRSYYLPVAIWYHLP
jgi:hypothetical protein